MIYITGDTHGDWKGRLHQYAFPEQKEMTKDDYVIILGDFGIWNNSPKENKNLDWLESRPFTTLFIDGNHENYDLLDAYPVTEWNGGKVHKIRNSVIHLMRGQVFTIEEQTFFTFGGASSHDIRDGILEPGDPRIKEWNYDYSKLFRINHVSWWERELPSEDEMKEGTENLKKYGNKVDYILTHCPYNSIMFLMMGSLGKRDRLTDYLQNIKETTEYKAWLFGHMHVNSVPSACDRSYCLFEQITRIC